jgi:hypothetical protein
MDEVGMAHAFLFAICHGRSPIGPHSPQPGRFRVSLIRGEFSDETDQAVLFLRKINWYAEAYSSSEVSGTLTSEKLKSKKAFMQALKCLQRGKD